MMKCNFNDGLKGLPFTMTEKTIRYLRVIADKIEKQDTQVIGIFWGWPGCGKSVLAQKFAYVVSGEKLTLDKIAFDKSGMIKAILISRQESVIGDEGISMFFSRAAMTKEGRLMAELMAQIRQKNLFLMICIPNILNVDSDLLAMANFICHVWESREPIRDRTGKPTGRYMTIKGNFRLYPNLRDNKYKDRMIQYLKIHKGNPLLKLKVPEAAVTEAGQPYGPDHKPCFYAVPEAEYKAKKEAILEKYRHALERKPRNTKVDYSLVDKLIKAKAKHKDIAQACNISIRAVELRAAWLRPPHKNRIKASKHRRKRH